MDLPNKTGSQNAKQAHAGEQAAKKGLKIRLTDGCGPFVPQSCEILPEEEEADGMVGDPNHVDGKLHASHTSVIGSLGQGQLNELLLVGEKFTEAMDCVLEEAIQGGSGHRGSQKTWKRQVKGILGGNNQLESGQMTSSKHKARVGEGNSKQEGEKKKGKREEGSRRQDVNLFAEATVQPCHPQ